MTKFIILTILIILPWFNPSSNPNDSVTREEKFFKLPTTEVKSGNLYEANVVKPLYNLNFYPVRDWSYENLELNAKSAIVMLKKSGKVLFNKNERDKLPIASLTKLLTAMAILEKIDTNKVVTITEKAVATAGDQGGLKVGENLTIQDLLFAMLMESSNDAAVQLEEVFNRENKFTLVETMNRIAERLSMNDSHFVNPTGLDSSISDQYSTAQDLTKLIIASLDRNLIWHILGLQEFTIISTEGNKHLLKSTNELLPLHKEMIGGKTGYTELAKGNFLAVLNSISNDDKIIIIVLGSDDRFGDAQKLINWIYKAYRW